MNETPRVSTGLGCFNLVLVVFSIFLLGWLCVRRPPVTPALAWMSAFGIGFVALVGIGILAGLLHSLNGELAREHGGMASLAAVSTGMLMIVPFAVLALIAELMLGWSAAQAFATAGVMAGAAGIGMEMSRLGASRPANAVLPALAGGLFIVTWMVLNLLVQAVGRG